MNTIPIWLVVGFLGAGKTTVLRRLVHHANGRGLLFIVNEFSAVDVDAGLVEREGGTAIAVAGGSIFCRCLITEFISTLTRVSEGIPMRTGEILQPQGVVIEASGMADPRSMRRLLQESGLDKHYHVAGVTTVVDPGILMKLLLVLPNIRGQIESADLILLNKTDLHAPETIAKVREKIALLNPSAQIVRCTYGNISPDLILSDGHAARIEEMDAAFGLCKDPNFEREVITLGAPVETAQLKALFAQAGDSLYRAKGFLRTTDGWHYLDWSSGRLSLKPCPPAPSSSLVLIWNPATATSLISQLRALEQHRK
ncbi:MAG: CobW family GTP-binding protein [bacterium]